MTVTGTEVLRAALRTRKLGLANIARELGLSTNALESFIAGGSLPADKLNAIAAEIFGGHAEFDATNDLLVATNRTPAISAGIRPPQFDPKSRPPVDRTIRGPSPPVKGATLQPARPHRPGWAE
jgi:hypothetical protein